MTTTNAQNSNATTVLTAKHIEAVIEQAKEVIRNTTHDSYGREYDADNDKTYIGRISRLPSYIIGALEYGVLPALTGKMVHLHGITRENGLEVDETILTVLQLAINLNDLMRSGGGSRNQVRDLYKYWFDVTLAA